LNTFTSACAARCALQLQLQPELLAELMTQEPSMTDHHRLDARLSYARLLALFVALLVALFAALLLAACGGGSDAPVEPPPGVISPPVLTPTAAFVAPATAAANAVVAFSAGGSASADGSALQYFWDFDNGQHGSGATIARMFASAGAKSVTLTVIDGAGRSASVTKTVTVSAPPAAAAQVTVEAVVKTLAGTALEGVSASVVGTATSGVTDALGKAHLSVGTNVPLTIKLSKPGYSDQFVRLSLPAGTGADATFNAVMRVRDAALTLADAAAGGSLSGRDGALLTLPPNALVTLTGTLVTGAVQVAVTPVDVTQPFASGFPGSFDGLTSAGVATPIVSLGVAEYAIAAGGQALQLAMGKTATIELPVYGTRRIDGTLVVAGDNIPLWSLDETTAVWVQEGMGTIVASAGSPTGLAMRATVSHFSWWNSDTGFDPYGPQPKCVADTSIGIPGGANAFATATMCNMLAEFDRGPPVAAVTGVTGVTGLSKRMAATVLSQRVVGYSRRTAVPIAGGAPMAVPAGVNIALTAGALNGTWSGRKVVNGAAFVQAEEVILMRPVATTGSGTEAITTPFDATRSLAAAQVALFSFSATTPRYARITASQGVGSNLTGRVRLLRGATALGSADFAVQSGQIVLSLPADDTYTVEVTPLTNAPGAYRLQVELLGGSLSEVLALPFNITKAVPDFSIYRGSFTVAAPGAASFVFQRLLGIGTARVLAPDGTPLLSALGGALSSETSVVALPVAGNYTLEIAPDGGRAANDRILAQRTSWLPAAPPLDGAVAGTMLVDLIADRNGKAVVGYARQLVVGGQAAGVAFSLRRWSGTAWEAAAADLTVDQPCTARPDAGITFAFDSNNDPVVAYDNKNNALLASNAWVSARRYTAGAWQALGSNNGMLPQTSPFGGACYDRPALAPGLNGALAIAYRSDANVVLQKFDGAAWVAITNAAADTFASQNGNFDLAADPAGRLHFVLTAGFAPGQASVVRRLSSAATPAWEALGTNGGVLPQTNTVALNNPQIRFDANGSPAIGTGASVGTLAASTAGLAIYRFNGSVWTSPGGFEADANGRVQSNGADVGFTLLGSDAFMSWRNVDSATPFAGPVLVAQKSGAAGAMTAIGGGRGELAQYAPNDFVQPFVSTSRLLAVGGEVYLAVLVNPTGAQFAAQNVTLLRKVSD
jgi:PKD repeat protein